MFYALADGTTTFDTDYASLSWGEAVDWNGQWWLGRETKECFKYQRLHLSHEGVFYLETRSMEQLANRDLQQLSTENAIRWLLRNDHAVPERLRLLIDEVKP